MRTTSSICFYCRQSKTDKQGLAPIELSLIINGNRVFINLPRKEYPEEFKKALAQKRNNPIKEYLFEVRNKFNEIQTEMLRANIPLSAQTLKDYYKTGGVKPYTLENLWNDYLTLQEKRIGSSLSKMAHLKYISARNIMYEFMSKDKEVATITPLDIQTILYSLQPKYKDSSLYSIMAKMKTLLTFARDNGKIQINPFQTIKFNKGKSNLEYLTEEEIALLVNKHFDIDRLEKVRDIAVFQIASGLAYVDTQNLKPEDIHYTEDGTCYIYKGRRKTGVEYTAVVFPEGAAVLQKYNNQLPKITNQKLNAYLKEIADLTHIKKNLHSHLFRKTYGTRLLNRGVRLETVSKCLGHTNTQITQAAYSKLLKPTIIKEVSAIF